MATMQINLREALKTRIAARAEESGFPSIEAYIESLLRVDAGDSEVVADADLEQLLLKRLESGTGVELSRELVKTFRRQVEERRQSNGKRA